MTLHFMLTSSISNLLKFVWVCFVFKISLYLAYLNINISPSVLSVIQGSTYENMLPVYDLNSILFGKHIKLKKFNAA